MCKNIFLVKGIWKLQNILVRGKAVLMVQTGLHDSIVILFFLLNDEEAMQTSETRRMNRKVLANPG